MGHMGGNRRTNKRHDYERKVFFDFIYDYKSNVEFEPHSQNIAPTTLKFKGTTQNLSAHGLCFTSGEELQRGAVIDVRVYPPNSENDKESLLMQGEVRWNKVATVDRDGEKLYATGVQIINVEGKPIDDTIYFDEKHQVYWGEVLEKLVGSYKVIKDDQLDDSHGA